MGRGGASQFEIDLREASQAALDNLWIPRQADLAIWLPMDPQAIDLTLILRSGPDILYAYFPFTVWIETDVGHREIVEFKAGNQETQICIPVPWHARWRGYVHVRLQSELGDIPARLNHSPDRRELAVLIARARRAPSETPSEPKSITHRHLPRRSFGIDQPPLAPQPIFVIGSYRSGTSVLTWAIGQHPNIWAVDETGWMPDLLLGAECGFRLSSDRPRSYWEVYRSGRAELFQWLGASIDDKIRRDSRERAEQAMLQGLSKRDIVHNPDYQLLRGRWNPKRRWVDGTPENTGYAPLLADAFPESKFILLVRDPRAVAASLMNFSAAGGKDYQLEAAIAAWTRLTLGGLRAAACLGPERVLIVLHEEMRLDPGAVMRTIWRFLDEPVFRPANAVFDHVINSSKVREIPALPDGAFREADELFAAVRSGDWSRRICRADAEKEFSAWLNDVATTRLAGRGALQSEASGRTS